MSDPHNSATPALSLSLSLSPSHLGRRCEYRNEHGRHDSEGRQGLCGDEHLGGKAVAAAAAAAAAAGD